MKARDTAWRLEMLNCAAGADMLRHRRKLGIGTYTIDYQDRRLTCGNGRTITVRYIPVAPPIQAADCATSRGWVTCPGSYRLVIVRSLTQSTATKCCAGDQAEVKCGAGPFGPGSKRDHVGGD
jgi:hypothetical protein